MTTGQNALSPLHRTLAIVAAVLIALVGLTAAAPRASAATADFDDVPASHAFHFHITWLAQQEITSGVGDGTNFAPAANITRGQMAVFLYKAAGSPAYTPPGSSPFSDVPPSHTFYKHIAWLYDEGIANGYGDGSFGPSDPITRGQMAVFLYKLAGSPTFEPSYMATFPDVPTTHSFYKHIEWLANEGITSGYGNGKFGPSNLVTRGQMAVFLYKYYIGFEPWAETGIDDDCVFYAHLYNMPAESTGAYMYLYYELNGSPTTYPVGLSYNTGAQYTYIESFIDADVAILTEDTSGLYTTSGDPVYVYTEFGDNLDSVDVPACWVP